MKQRCKFRTKGLVLIGIFKRLTGFCVCQLEIEKLKAENDRLKVENQGSRTGSQASISSSPSPHTLSQTAVPGPGLSQHSLNLTSSESTSLGKTRNFEDFFYVYLVGNNKKADFALSGADMLLDDTGGEGAARKEGRHVKVVVSLDEGSKWGEVRAVSCSNCHCA